MIQGCLGCARVGAPGGVTIPSEVEFTLVLTIVLGLCVGAVVADVLFGPEQPATSSSGSHGHQWDPWRRWLHQGRESFAAFARWSREHAERGWVALTRSFPARQQGPSAPSADVLPPPVAPPLHPERVSSPRATFVGTRSEGWDDPRPLVEPPPTTVPASPDALTGTFPEPSTEVAEGTAPRSESGSSVATALRPSTEPGTVTIPRHVRVKAGAGLVLFTAVAGISLAMVILLVIGLAARALGGI